MKLSLKIKKMYTYFCMAEDKEGNVKCNQVVLPFVFQRICWTHTRV